jgi:hypothetical protein
MIETSSAMIVLSAIAYASVDGLNVDIVFRNAPQLRVKHADEESARAFYAKLRSGLQRVHG